MMESILTAVAHWSLIFSIFSLFPLCSSFIQLTGCCIALHASSFIRKWKETQDVCSAVSVCFHEWIGTSVSGYRLSCHLWALMFADEELWKTFRPNTHPHVLMKMQWITLLLMRNKQFRFFQNFMHWSGFCQTAANLSGDGMFVSGFSKVVRWTKGWLGALTHSEWRMRRVVPFRSNCWSTLKKGNHWLMNHFLLEDYFLMKMCWIKLVCCRVTDQFRASCCLFVPLAEKPPVKAYIWMLLWPLQLV